MTYGKGAENITQTVSLYIHFPLLSCISYSSCHLLHPLSTTVKAILLKAEGKKKIFERVNAEECE